MDIVQTPQLDAIHLDEFTVTLPSGKRVTPHRGQTVWVYGYGRGSDETAEWQRRISAAEDGAPQLHVLCEFLASEIARWDLINARTGQPYNNPTAEEVKRLPDPLFIFLSRRILGGEDPGKGGAASGS